MMAPSSPQIFSALIFQIEESSSRRQSKDLMKLSRSGLCRCGVETICRRLRFDQDLGIGTINLTWKVSGSSHPSACTRISSANSRYRRTAGLLLQRSAAVWRGLATGEILKIFSIGQVFFFLPGVGGVSGCGIFCWYSASRQSGSNLWMLSV